MFQTTLFRVSVTTRNWSLLLSVKSSFLSVLVGPTLTNSWLKTDQSHVRYSVQLYMEQTFKFELL